MYVTYIHYIYINNIYIYMIMCIIHTYATLYILEYIGICTCILQSTCTWISKDVMWHNGEPRPAHGIWCWCLQSALQLSTAVSSQWSTWKDEPLSTDFFTIFFHGMCLKNMGDLDWFGFTVTWLVYPQLWPFEVGKWGWSSGFTHSISTSDLTSDLNEFP